MNGILSFFTKKYVTDHYVDYKKAQLLTVMNFVYLLFLILLAVIRVGNYLKGTDVKGLASIVVAISSAFIALFLIKYGFMQRSADLIAVLATLANWYGFITRDYNLAYVSFAFFMVLVVVYATLLCSKYLSTLILLSLIVLHVYKFKSLLASGLSEIEYEIIRSGFTDGIIVLILSYTISISISTILKNAIKISNEESGKNISRLTQIKKLNETIQDTSAVLNESVKESVSIIDQFADNAQNQAASIEEFSASMEEISAGTENTVVSVREQTDSLKELINTIEELSHSIDQMEIYGKDIAEKFNLMTQMSEKGELSSTELDQTNQRLLDNSNNILSVTVIIEEFFEKINLLSLNASIEAARAGEFGRGFAVVAEEIGKLADSSARELKQISELIERNKRDVQSTSTIINNIVGFIKELSVNIILMKEGADQTLKGITQQETLRNNMNTKTDIVKRGSEQIIYVMQEQKAAIDEMVKSIENINKLVQENALNTENLRGSSIILQDKADELIDIFDTSEE